MTNLPKNLIEVAENKSIEHDHKMRCVNDASNYFTAKDSYLDGFKDCYSHLCQAPEGFREFWLDDCGDWNMTAYTSERKFQLNSTAVKVHVIEYAAIAQLKAKLESELELLRKQLEKCKEMLIEKLMDENHSEMHPVTARSLAEAEIDEKLAAIGKG